MVYFVHKKELGSSSPLISIYFSSDNIQQFGRNTLLTQFIIFQLQFVQQFFRIIVRRLMAITRAACSDTRLEQIASCILDRT